MVWMWHANPLGLCVREPFSCALIWCAVNSSAYTRRTIPMVLGVNLMIPDWHLNKRQGCSGVIFPTTVCRSRQSCRSSCRSGLVRLLEIPVVWQLAQLTMSGLVRSDPFVIRISNVVPKRSTSKKCCGGVPRSVLNPPQHPLGAAVGV